MKKNILALIIFAVIAAPALAEDTAKRYVGVSIGSASFSNISPSTHPNVFKILSGYHFNPMLAVEVGYSMFGNVTVSNGVSSANVSTASWQTALVGTLPISQDFDLIGKIGLAHNIGTGTNGSPLPGRSGNFISHNDIFLGLGAQYNINSKFSLLASYDNYGKFENAASPIKASSTTLGLIYHY